MNILKDRFTILIVDNEPDINSKNAEWLRDIGYNTESAFSRVEAEKMIGSSPQKYDIALIDMRMEEDDSGVKLTQFIFENTPWIMSVIMTAYPDLNDAAKCMRSGACGYLIKGDSPIELIREVLREAAFRRTSLAAFEELSESLSELMSQIQLTKQDIQVLERRLELRDKTVQKMLERVNRLLGRS